MNIRSVNGRRLMVGAVKRTNAGSAIFIFLMSLCYLPAIGQIADLSTISVNGNVSSIIVDGGYTYIGGSFTQVGGQTRNMVARLKADGTLDPDFTSPFTAFTGGVFTMSIDPSTQELYVRR